MGTYDTPTDFQLDLRGKVGSASGDGGGTPCDESFSIDFLMNTTSATAAYDHFSYIRPDGCIVWNAHNTVLARSARLSMRLSQWTCPKITCGQSNLR